MRLNLLAVVRLLKKCIVFALKDWTRNNPLIRRATGKKKFFQIFKQTVLLRVCTFLEWCAEDLLRCGLQFDFSNSDSLLHLTSLISKDVIYGLLEASKLEFIDRVSLFCEELVDGLCSRTKSESVLQRLRCMWTRRAFHLTNKSLFYNVAHQYGISRIKAKLLISFREQLLESFVPRRC